MTIKSNLPNLRFKDRQGRDYPNWQIEKIQNISDINPLSHERLPLSFIYIDLESVVSGRLIKQNVMTRKRAPSRAQRVLQPGDVLFQTVRPYQQNNLFFNINGDYVASTGYAQLRAKKSAPFLYQLMHRQKFVNLVLARCTGTSYPAVSSRDLGSIKVYVCSSDEQQKIADFLSAVDEKIEHLEKKRSLLEKYKQGLMQRLFSRELRFKDENGEEYPRWEELLIHDIAEVTRGAGLSKSDLKPDGQYSCILYGELFTKYKVSIRRVHSSTDEPTSVIGEYGDILMPTSDVTPDGLATASALLLPGVQLGGDINIIRLRRGDHPVFVSYMLNFFKSKIVRLVSGTTVKHIYPRDIRSVKLIVPRSRLEQQKIADLLSTIDEKIDLVSRQIKRARTFKQGLLQRLFV